MTTAIAPRTLDLLPETLPEYHHRAKVRAIKILRVGHVSTPEHGLLLYCEPTAKNPRGFPYFLQASQYTNRTPHDGQMWVHHDDGQMSFLEQDVFDKEYEEYDEA